MLLKFMSKKLYIVSCLTLVLLSLGFLYLSTWTFGLEGDHAGYWQYSWITPMGDFETYGKSPVFYQINYQITHTIGKWLGNRQSLSVSIFYLFIFAASLSYFSQKNYLNFKNSFFPAVALWVSPIFYFFLTQFMMETPLLILVFIFSAALHKSDLTFSRKHYLLIFLFFTFAISLKESVLPAFVLILFWKWIENRSAFRNCMKLLGLMVIAFVAFKILITHYQKVAFPFHVTMSTLTSEYIQQKISYFPRVLWTYVWFLIPALILAPFSKSKLKFFSIFALGLLLTSVIHMISTLNSQRYYAPIIAAVMIIAFLTYSPADKKLRNSIFSVIIVVNLFFITSNYFLTPFSLWPNTVQREHIESGASVLYGFPTYRWLISHGRYDEQLCVYVPTNNGEMNYYIERALPGIFGNNAMAIHTTLSEAEKCPHSGIMYRSYDPPPQELFDFCKTKNLKMYEGRHRITYFSLDGHKTEENPGYLYNLTCI